MSEKSTCSKCGSNSRKGFFYVRNSNQTILINSAVWVEGEKEKITSFMGTKVNAPQYPVTSYKYDSSGYIEFFGDHLENWRH